MLSHLQEAVLLHQEIDAFRDELNSANISSNQLGTMRSRLEELSA